MPWPEWAITTIVDARPCGDVWKAVSCHDSHVASYQRLKTLAEADHEVWWGRQCFYRVFSTGEQRPASGDRGTLLRKGLPTSHHESLEAATGSAVC